MIWRRSARLSGEPGSGRATRSPARCGRLRSTLDDRPGKRENHLPRKNPCLWREGGRRPGEGELALGAELPPPRRARVSMGRWAHDSRPAWRRIESLPTREFARRLGFTWAGLRPQAERRSKLRAGVGPTPTRRASEGLLCSERVPGTESGQRTSLASTPSLTTDHWPPTTTISGSIPASEGIDSTIPGSASQPPTTWVGSVLVHLRHPLPGEASARLAFATGVRCEWDERSWIFRS
jgi:hypothetical protein